MIDLDEYIPLMEMDKTSTRYYHGNQLKIIYCYPNKVDSQRGGLISFTYCNN